MSVSFQVYLTAQKVTALWQRGAADVAARARRAADDDILGLVTEAEVGNGENSRPDPNFTGGRRFSKAAWTLREHQ